MKNCVIVVAGGQGLRMGSTIPKQFLEINGKAIILHTLEKFKKALPSVELFLVLPKNEKKRWKEIASGTDFEQLPIANGGETRFESVKAGLNLVPENSLVAVHDAVRPLVSSATIREVFKIAKENGNAIPVIPVKDSIRQVKQGSSTSLNRDHYRIVQTPQCFKSEILLKAYQQAYQAKFTDDASVVEAMGIEICLVEGNNSNIKITTKEDLDLAELKLKN